MKKVLGLDVSMNSTGWAVLSVTKAGKARRVASGIIKANTKLNHGKRLRNQRDTFQGIVKRYKPDFVGMEAGFAHHVKSTQVLFKAYGVTEEFFNGNLDKYAASTIKKYTTGNGRATKEEVETAIRKSLDLPDYKFETNDESDAVAVALTVIYDKGLIKHSKRGEK